MHSINKIQGVFTMLNKTQNSIKTGLGLLCKSALVIAACTNIASAQGTYTPSESGSTRQSIVDQILRGETPQSLNQAAANSNPAVSSRFQSQQPMGRSQSTSAGTSEPARLPKMRTPTIPSHPRTSTSSRPTNTATQPKKLAYETRISQQDVDRHAPPTYDAGTAVSTADYNAQAPAASGRPETRAGLKPDVELASATGNTRAASAKSSDAYDASFSLDSKLQEIRRIQEKEGFAVADRNLPSQETFGTATDDLHASPAGNAGSFLDREKEAKSKGSADSASTRETIVKIVVNLAFVLAMGIGFIVLVRMWNMARKTSSLGNEREKKQLKVREVLSLGGGVCLHVVDGPRNQFLVAVDSSGIKSVNVMNASFEDSMEMLESGDLEEQFENDQDSAPTMEELLGQLASREYQLQETKSSREVEPDPEPTRRASVSSTRTRVRTGSRRANQAPEPIEQSKELDEKLISMLLKKGKKAA